MHVFNLAASDLTKADADAALAGAAAELRLGVAPQQLAHEALARRLPAQVILVEAKAQLCIGLMMIAERQRAVRQSRSWVLHYYKVSASLKTQQQAHMLRLMARMSSSVTPSWLNRPPCTTSTFWASRCASGSQQKASRNRSTSTLLYLALICS